MKKVILSLAVIALSTTATLAQLKDGVFNVDYKASSIQWHGEKATGSGHDGTIRVSSGQVTVKGGNVASGKVKVDMNGITCTDLTDKDMNANLINHLKSEDFFNTVKFPDANFEVVSVTAAKDAAGNTHTINGKLTIKGITKDVSFPAKVAGTDANVTINGVLNVDRSQFDVRYGSETFFGTLGDKAISNNMRLTINLVANKKA